MELSIEPKPIPKINEKGDYILSEYKNIEKSLFNYQGEIYDKKELCKRETSTPCKDNGMICDNLNQKKRNLTDSEQDTFLYDLLVPYYFEDESNASSFKSVFDKNKTEYFNSLYRTNLIKDELFTKLNENIKNIEYILFVDLENISLHFQSIFQDERYKHNLIYKLMKRINESIHKLDKIDKNNIMNYIKLIISKYYKNIFIIFTDNGKLTNQNTSSHKTSHKTSRNTFHRSSSPSFDSTPHSNCLYYFDGNNLSLYISSGYTTSEEDDFHILWLMLYINKSINKKINFLFYSYDNYRWMTTIMSSIISSKNYKKINYNHCEFYYDNKIIIRDLTHVQHIDEKIKNFISFMCLLPLPVKYIATTNLIKIIELSIYMKNIFLNILIEKENKDDILIQNIITNILALYDPEIRSTSPIPILPSFTSQIPSSPNSTSQRPASSMHSLKRPSSPHPQFTVKLPPPNLRSNLQGGSTLYNTKKKLRKMKSKKLLSRKTKSRKYRLRKSLNFPYRNGDISYIIQEV
jgi:hypothetical protein